MKSNFQIILLEDLYVSATRVDTKLSTYAFVLIFCVYILQADVSQRRQLDETLTLKERERE